MTFEQVKDVFKRRLAEFKNSHPDFKMYVSLQRYCHPSKGGGKKDEIGVVISSVYRSPNKIDNNMYGEIHARIPFENDGTYIGTKPTEPIIEICNAGKQLRYYEFDEMYRQFELFTTFVNTKFELSLRLMPR